MGDFNYSDINWRLDITPADLNHPSTMFRECLRDNFLFQHVYDPTHFRGSQTPNTLDLIITNEEGMINQLELAAPIGKSHHVCIHFQFNCYIDPPKSQNPKYIYHKGNYDQMREEIRQIDWQILTIDSSEQAYKSFTNNIKSLMDKHIPKTRPNTNRKKRPRYMTAKTLEKVKEKNKKFSTWRNSRDNTDYLLYSRARNQAKWECRKAEKDFEKKIAREAKTNPKAFYRYAQSKLKTRSRLSDLLSTDGELITSDKGKANEMNNFFTSVFTRENITSMPEFPDQEYNSPLTDITITPEEVKKMLDNLNPNKSPGPDGIHPRVLRELSTELAIPLRDIFQLTLETRQLPTEWKLGQVSPIFKKGSKLKPGNYRLVSLTSVACKVMEKIVRDRITNHLNRNQLLTDCQHGFIKGRSCVTQLLAMLDKWTEILDQGGNIDAIYLDFSKCFDSVPHERLLLKLKKYGIQGTLWDWVADFLRGRKQQVSVNSYLSTLISAQWDPPRQRTRTNPVHNICE